VIHNWPYAARKRTGNAESGWRPPPDKNIEPVSYWGKNSPEKCLVYLGLKNIGHSDPADMFGGKTPDRAFWNAQIHATSSNTVKYRSPLRACYFCPCLSLHWGWGSII